MSVHHLESGVMMAITSRQLSCAYHIHWARLAPYNSSNMGVVKTITDCINSRRLTALVLYYVVCERQHALQFIVNVHAEGNLRVRGTR